MNNVNIQYISQYICGVCSGCVGELKKRRSKKKKQNLDQHEYSTCVYVYERHTQDTMISSSLFPLSQLSLSLAIYMIPISFHHHHHHHHHHY
jgi:hypothetical protein